MNTTSTGLRLDRVNGRIREWSHSSGNQTEDHRLPRWQLGRSILRLVFFGNPLEFLVRGKVDTYESGLSERFLAEL